MKRFIVTHIGARRNYAIPSILEKAGMLEAFYTDMCASSGIGALLDCYCPTVFKKGAINRLLNRRLPPNLATKVRTADLPTLSYLYRQKKARQNTLESHKALSLFNREFSRWSINKGLGKATHIFSMFGEGTDFLEFAKEQGLNIVNDIYISPLTYKIIQQEKTLYAELESTIPEEIIEQSYYWWERISKITDVFFAPSNFVITGLEEFGINQDRCYKVPYAVDNSWFKVKNNSQVGRILFAGTANLRKGIHLLGIAAQEISHLDYEFRVAGGVSNVIKQHKLTRKLNFLGRIPRANIQQEFAHADIFVLPSLAEGSAGVTYEALAAGLPVITTEAAGSVVRDGIEGFIVPTKDPDTLARKIKELIENRELRNRMATAAKERAKEYTWDKYAERLLTVFRAI